MVTWPRLLCGVLLALLVLLGIQQCRLTSRDRQIAKLQEAPYVQGVLVAQAKVETLTVRLAARVDTVRKTIVRVRVDTFEVAPRTPAETTKAVSQLPTLVAAHDTLQRQCSALTVTCEDYRRASEVRDTAQRNLIGNLRVQLRGAQPSRLGATWNRVKVPFALGVGLYFGAKVVK